MKNREYWEERAISKDKLLEKDINKLEKKLLKLFKDTRKEVLNELKIIYADIESTEYAKYQIDSLLASINKAIDNLYNQNEKEIFPGNFLGHICCCNPLQHHVCDHSFRRS